jgi:hypothetical protein
VQYIILLILIKELLIRGRLNMDREIVLKINGQEVMLKYFVKDVFMNVINGLIDTLDKVPVDRDRKIEIEIKNK